MLKNTFKPQSLTHFYGISVPQHIYWIHTKSQSMCNNKNNSPVFNFLILFSECNCNEFSHRCFFDKELYDRTGHGGHCLDCAGNRDGANCERCKENYYQRKGDSHCSPCECNEVGKCRMQQPIDFLWFSWMLYGFSKYFFF